LAVINNKAERLHKDMINEAGQTIDWTKAGQIERDNWNHEDFSTIFEAIELKNEKGKLVVENRIFKIKKNLAEITEEE